MEIFGLCISNKLQNLIDEIFSLYKKPVQFKDVKKLPPEYQRGLAYLGAAREENGIPTVYVNVKDGLYEENIAHELLHLKLEYQGFPRTTFPQGSLEAISASELLSIMEHRLIYDELEKMGYNPHESLRKSAEEQLIPELKKEFPWSEFPPIKRKVVLSIIYTRAKIELNNKDIIKQIDKLFVKKIKESRIIGEGLLAVILKQNPITPNEIKRALKGCFKILGVPQETILNMRFSNHNNLTSSRS